jgi:hypothetical protein
LQVDTATLRDGPYLLVAKATSVEPVAFPDNVVWFYHTIDNGVCNVVLDFETEDDFTTPLVNGQDVSQPEEFGYLVWINGVNASNLGAAIFDSDTGGPNNPGRDPDLLVNSGNVLILQDDSVQTVPGIFDFPDDDGQGGTITFDFLQSVAPAAITLIDINEAAAQLVLTDGNGRQRTYTVPVGWTGEVSDLSPDLGKGVLSLAKTKEQPGPGPGGPAMMTVPTGPNKFFDPHDVRKLEVTFYGDGAVDDLVFCPTP